MVREKVLDDIKKRLDKIAELKKDKGWKIEEAYKILAYNFAKRLMQDFHGFVHAVILFGSVERSEAGKDSDIDVLVLVDDITVPTTSEIMGSYRLGIMDVKSQLKGGEKLHINTLQLTTFWDGVRHGDPIIINMIRYGIPLVDTGFFTPLKALLEDGRIRPSKEAIEAHIKRARGVLMRADDHIAIAIDDLYWAAIDAAHAALMSEGKIPETPGKIPSILEKEFVGKGKPLLEKDIAEMKEVYDLMKSLSSRKTVQVQGKVYDKHRESVQRFVEKMAKIVQKNENKKLE